MSNIEVKNYTGYGLIHQSVMRNKNISISCKALYSYLASFAGTTGKAFPSVSLIMGELDISKDTFYKYVKELETNGLISITKVRDQGKFSRNVYHLHSEISPCPKSSDTVSSYTVSSDTTNKDTKSNILKINSLKNNSGRGKPKKQPRKKYGEYQHILLTEAQHTKLIKDYSKQVIDNMIQKMDEWIQLHGKTYKDYNLALRKWLREDKTEQPKAPVYKDLGAE